jgi:Coenzyme PQQ synthesis protein D (PqqD)
MTQVAHPDTGGSFRPSAGVIARRMGRSAVLVHLPTNRIFELNDTGARIWELVEAGASREQVIADLAGQYAVDPTEASREVELLIEQLRLENLLEP